MPLPRTPQPPLGLRGALGDGGGRGEGGEHRQTCTYMGKQVQMLSLTLVSVCKDEAELGKGGNHRP